MPLGQELPGSHMLRITFRMGFQMTLPDEIKPIRKPIRTGIAFKQSNFLSGPDGPSGPDEYIKVKHDFYPTSKVGCNVKICRKKEVSP